MLPLFPLILLVWWVPVSLPCDTRAHGWVAWICKGFVSIQALAVNYGSSWMFLRHSNSTLWLSYFYTEQHPKLGMRMKPIQWYCTVAHEWEFGPHYYAQFLETINQQTNNYCFKFSLAVILTSEHVSSQKKFSIFSVSVMKILDLTHILVFK